MPAAGLQLHVWSASNRCSASCAAPEPRCARALTPLLHSWCCSDLVKQRLRDVASTVLTSCACANRQGCVLLQADAACRLPWLSEVILDFLEARPHVPLCVLCCGGAEMQRLQIYGHTGELLDDVNLALLCMGRVLLVMSSFRQQRGPGVKSSVSIKWLVVVDDCK